MFRSHLMNFQLIFLNEESNSKIQLNDSSDDLTFFI